jgi:DNA-directed RNA polymerase specialized sigma24 family protein
MGELSAQDPEPTRFDSFASRWFEALLAGFLRRTRSPGLAYDLATETLAAAHLQWQSAPDGDEAAAWLLRIGASVLDATVTRGRVPSTERRRIHQSLARELSVAEQREIAALAEHHIELPAGARDAADTLARMAPPPHILRKLRLSGLVQTAPLPDHERTPNGT